MPIGSTSRIWRLPGLRSLGRLVVAIAVVCVTALTAAPADAEGFALEFDGTQQVDGTNPLLPQGNAARTMEAWIKPSVLHNGTIFNYGEFAGNKRAGILYIAGRLYFVGEFNDIIGSIVLPVGDWTHVAVSYDGALMTLYVNGVVDVTAALPAGPHNTTGFNWRIGNGSDINFLREPFKGTIDDVRVWDHARTQAQIQASMEFFLTGDEPGLVAYYRLDDGPGSTTAADSSPNMSDGVLDGTGPLPDWVAGFALTDPNGGFGPFNRPVYLILSLEQEFSTPTEEECEEGDNGSQTYVLNIGTFVAGDEIPNTRFDILAVLEDIELPEGTEFEDLDGFEFTLVGSFDTFSASSIHLVSPTDDDIAAEVQEAFFRASPFFDQIPGFPTPTTVETAQFIFDIATGFGVTDEFGAPVGFQEILDSLYITDDSLTCTDCQAEGEMFPHDDVISPPLFGFDFTIDEDLGTLAIDVCLKVGIDIKPGSDKNPINLKSKGVEPVAILTTASFDPVDLVDVSTATLNGAPVDKYSVEDVDGDGDDDLLLKFKTQDLVAAGVDEDTEALEFHAETTDGRCVEGSDAVTIPPSGKKK